MNTKKYAVIDIDGCVVDCSARMHLFDRNGDLAAFHDAWEMDEPIQQGIWLVLGLFLSEYKIVFNTSRDEGSREHTLLTLNKFLPELGGRFMLLMRPAGGKHNPETQPQEKLAALTSAGIHPDDVFLAVDDRLSICEAYRAQGIVSWQLGPDWN